MSYTRWIYVARLVPIRRHLEVVDPSDGQICEYFDDCCFALERKHPERVSFLLDHDPRREAGQFTTLIVHGGWLLGTFSLHDSTPGAIAADRLKRGSPISVGFDPELDRELGHSGTIHRQIAKLNEASLVERAAYPGACIVDVLKPSQSPAAAPTSDRAAVGEEVIYNQRIVRHNIGQVLGVR